MANYNNGYPAKRQRLEENARGGFNENFGGGEGDFFEGNPPNHIVHITVVNAKYPITVDVVKSISSSHGKVLKIAISKKNGVQALVEFDSVDSARKAKEGLDGEDIYSGCCTLKVDFARLKVVNVKKNDTESWDYTRTGTKKPLLGNAPEELGNDGSTDRVGLMERGGISGNMGLVSGSIGGGDDPVPMARGGPIGRGPGFTDNMGRGDGFNRFQGNNRSGPMDRGGMSGNMGLSGLMDRGGMSGNMGLMSGPMGGGDGPGPMARVGPMGRGPGFTDNMGRGDGFNRFQGNRFGGPGPNGGLFQGPFQGGMGPGPWFGPRFDDEPNLPFGDVPLGMGGQGGRGPGGPNQDSAVVMFYELNPEKVNCDNVFNLLCIYGNVLKVKFLKSKESCCMVQMSDGDAVRRVLENLNGIFIFGKKTQMGHSKQPYLKDVNQPHELPDKTPSFKTYYNDRNNRFLTPEAARKNKIHPPTRVLYFFNAPHGVSEDRIKKIFEDKGLTPKNIKILPSKNEKSDSGLVEFSKKSEAIEAIMLGNHFTLDKIDGKFPYTLKFTFSPTGLNRTSL